MVGGVETGSKNDLPGWGVKKKRVLIGLKNRYCDVKWGVRGQTG